MGPRQDYTLGFKTVALIDFSHFSSLLFLIYFENFKKVQSMQFRSTVVSKGRTNPTFFLNADPNPGFVIVPTFLKS